MNKIKACHVWTNVEISCESRIINMISLQSSNRKRIGVSLNDLSKVSRLNQNVNPGNLAPECMI